MSQQYDTYTPTILNTSTVCISSCKFAQQVADGSFAWDHMRYCLAPSVNDNLCSEHQQFTIGCHEAWTDPVQLQLQHCSRQFLTCTWFIRNQSNMRSHKSTPPKPSHRSYKLPVFNLFVKSCFGLAHARIWVSLDILRPTRPWAFPQLDREPVYNQQLGR